MCGENLMASLRTTANTVPVPPLTTFFVTREDFDLIRPRTIVFKSIIESLDYFSIPKFEKESTHFESKMIVMTQFQWLEFKIESFDSNLNSSQAFGNAMKLTIPSLYINYTNIRKKYYLTSLWTWKYLKYLTSI